MKPETGRCAILFPHGVLFRDEEREMRKRIIEADLIDCVLGLGPSLFYNWPMEACVVICRTQKPPERQGKVLFINAVNEVTREQAQSFLRDRNISAHRRRLPSMEDEAGFARIVDTDELLANDGSLNLPLYVAVSADPNGHAPARNFDELLRDLGFNEGDHPEHCARSTRRRSGWALTYSTSGPQTGQAGGDSPSATSSRM